MIPLLISKYSEYLIQRGRGITCFSCQENEFVEVKKSLHLTAHKYSVYSLSGIFGKTALDKREIGQSRGCLIYQDLPIQEFKSIIHQVLNAILFPYYFRFKPIFFLSKHSWEKYQPTISKDALHGNLVDLEKELLTEQFFTILDYTTCRREDLYDQEYPVTVIQQRWRNFLNSNRVEFSECQRISGIYVDFMVWDQGKRIPIQCDGGDIRSPFYNPKYDQILKNEGFEAVHVTPSGSLMNIRTCFHRILNQFEAQRHGFFPIDKNLDENQKKAVQHMSGPIRVLAPAGAGKTKTLINRVLNLINAGIPGGQILALAFNKKAAVEMEKRLTKLGTHATRQMETDSVSVMTFHAFGYNIIRQHLGWEFTLSNVRTRSYELMKKVVEKQYGIKYCRNGNILDILMDALSRSKMDLSIPDEISLPIDEDNIIFPPVFREYLNLQYENRFITFDDMLYISLCKIIEDPGIRQKLQQRFEYILVDEFQDLNRAQLLLVQILSMPQNNLFIVGDDDQMIYGWRGAEVTHILDFHENYADSSDVVLARNYRSNQRIVRHSRWLIDHNNERVPKNITPRDDANHGTIMIELCESLYQQAVRGIKWIKNHKQLHKQSWEDYAILFRYNSYQFLLAALLDQEGIPHTQIDLSRLFATSVGRDIVAYTQILLNKNHYAPDNWYRVLTRPTKYLPRDFVHNIDSWDVFKANQNIDLTLWQQDQLEKFSVNLHWARKTALDRDISPKEFIRLVAEVFRLEEFYSAQQSEFFKPDDASDTMVLEVIETYAENFKSLDIFSKKLCNIESTETEIEQNKAEKNSGVVLSTIHSTKGNEYKNVVYFNLDSKVDSNPELIEQERRVCYVGMTRAIENLCVTAPQKKFSRFLTEFALNPDLSGYTTRKLRRKLRKLRKNLKTNQAVQKKRHSGKRRAWKSQQLNVFNHKRISGIAYQKNKQENTIEESLKHQIELLDTELTYRKIFFPEANSEIGS